MKKICFPKSIIGILYIVLAVLTSVFILVSTLCNKKMLKPSPQIDLSKSFTWGLVDEPFYPTQAELLQIDNPLKLGKKNLSNIVGMKSHYIWLKAEFTIPPELREKDLGFFVTYIHFADKVWINGKFAGGYGRFPPLEITPLYLSHAYYFPKEALNYYGKNTILIQVYNHGKGEVSGKAFVSDQVQVHSTEKKISFWNTYSYTFFTGGMFAAMALFFFLFILHKRRPEYVWFSLLNLCTIAFCATLFVPIFPFYETWNVPFYIYYRTSFCFTGMVNFVLWIAFARNYIDMPRKKLFDVLRLVILSAQIFILMLTRDYDDLIKVCPVEFILTGFNIVLLFYYVLRGFSVPEYRRRARNICLCLIPFVISILVDIILRGILGITTLPFFSFFGWQLNILSYLFVLSHSHASALVANEYLNKNLQEEVLKQTENLHLANERLLDRIHRSNIDLQMASVVQQRLFQAPHKNFMGWDIAVSYEPLSEVSGDFFDFYGLGTHLDGISLFDVSGHGVAASLVTMLCKSIVYNAFQKNRFYDVPISKCLLDVNHDLIVAKGSIDNYMTGIMMRFGSFDDSDACKIDFSNAGHPRPIVYSAERGECIEVGARSDGEQHGAIGMMNVDVKFQDQSFEMKKDDILVIYTDGLSEAENLQHEQFGKKRIMDILKESHTKNAHRIIEELAYAVKFFVAEADRKDDITIMVLKREDSKDFLEALDSD